MDVDVHGYSAVFCPTLHWAVRRQDKVLVYKGICHSVGIELFVVVAIEQDVTVKEKEQVSTHDGSLSKRFPTVTGYM